MTGQKWAEPIQWGGNYIYIIGNLGGGQNADKGGPIPHKHCLHGHFAIHNWLPHTVVRGMHLSEILNFIAGKLARQFHKTMHCCPV